MEPLGLETPGQPPGKAAKRGQGGAESGAVAGDLATLADPELARIVAVWHSLPVDARQRILAIVGGAEGLDGRFPRDERL
jgi:hypothetical protein